jgi:hypothetical protein
MVAQNPPKGILAFNLAMYLDDFFGQLAPTAIFSKVPVFAQELLNKAEKETAVSAPSLLKKLLGDSTLYRILRS